MFVTILNDLSLLLVFLLIGFAIRELVPPIQKMFIPAGIIGGVIAIIAGPQGLGLIETPESWSQMPGTMVGVVLACTMFGVTFNRNKMKSYLGAINILFSTYFAQLFVGTLVGIGLAAIWKMNPVWGSYSPFAFWGGFGYTAAANAVYESQGITDVQNLGIILATLGVILSMVLGMVIVNIGVRRGLGKNAEVTIEGDGGTIPVDKQKPIGFANVSSSAVSPLALQLGLVLSALLLGQYVFKFLANFSSLFDNAAMILCGIVGAAILWQLMRMLKLDKYVDHKSMNSLSGVALEICILSATATIDIRIFADYLLPIVLLTASIMLVMFLYVFVIIPRWIKVAPFEFALMVFGLSVGSTPSGLALARCVDPDMHSEAWDAFGVASGVSASICALLSSFLPLIGAQSVWSLVLIGGGVTLVSFIIGELLINVNFSKLT